MRGKNLFLVMFYACFIYLQLACVLGGGGASAPTGLRGAGSGVRCPFGSGHLGPELPLPKPEWEADRRLNLRIRVEESTLGWTVTPGHQWNRWQ